MLKALYDYALSHDLALAPGIIRKQVKAYIVLSATGKFMGIEMTDDAIIPCPDIGSLSQGADKCNVLAEKCSVVLATEGNAKNAFFKRTLKDGAIKEPMLGICLRALEDEATLTAITHEAIRHGLNPSDRISFRVDGCSILSSPAVMDWWSTYRLQFTENGKGYKAPCLITGESITPPATLPQFMGLRSVGGHASGSALIGFNQPAFCSYGLKQGENAPVSETAFAAVKAALDDLLSNAPTLAGMKFVHWYDGKVAQKEDVLLNICDGLGMESDDEPQELPPWQEKEAAASAQKQADDLIKSVHTGHAPPLANEYYILLVTGVGGRIMVRRYIRGSYQILQENLSVWRKDIALLNDAGTAEIGPRKLTGLLMRLLSRQKNENDVFKRLSKELSGVTANVIAAILACTPLPTEVAVRALAYIRSQMLSGNEDSSKLMILDARACQWLKAWLLRQERKDKQEESLMTEYNPNHFEPAYHCGALMAVYAAIQFCAMGDVDANVIQRYYASAMQTPALVIGRLSILSTYHLAKIESPFVVRKYEEMLNEVCSAIGYVIPVTLNMEQQGYFVLGYRQYCTKLAREKAEAIAAWKAKNDKEK